MEQDRPPPPRSTLNSPLGKTLLSVRSRSKSLPPESEEWELWGVAVPRGGEVNLSAGTSLPCLQIQVIVLETRCTLGHLEKGD